ncbi:MAG: tRNA lysidine(34) synthetase TilS [Pirellulales bacterium]
MARSHRLEALTAAVEEAVADCGRSQIVVAWSGGSDSTALVLAALARGPLRAVHVHHGQRHSDAAETHVREVAARLGIPLEVVRIDVGEGASFEERARDLRLAELADHSDDDTIVLLGHHMDDLVETVLHNLFRGAGPRGLSGPQRVRLPFARPFLGETRAMLAAAVADAGVSIFEDPTNQELVATRNWIRNTVLPEITTRFTSAAASIGQASRLIAADDALLESQIPDVVRSSWGAMTIPVGVTATLARPLATRLIRRMLVLARPPNHASRRDVEQVMSVVEGHQQRAQLEGGYFAEREGALVAVYSPDLNVAPPPLDLSIPGSALFGSLRISVQPWNADRPIIGRDRAVVAVGSVDSVEIRSAAHGDRIDIGDGSKLVFDALSEAGIPRRRRSGWPVVRVRGNIAWIAGVRAAAWVRPGRADHGIVELAVERVDQ